MTALRLLALAALLLAAAGLAACSPPAGDTFPPRQDDARPRAGPTFSIGGGGGVY